MVMSYYQLTLFHAVDVLDHLLLVFWLCYKARQRILNCKLYISEYLHILCCTELFIAVCQNKILLASTGGFEKYIATKVNLNYRQK